MEFALNKQKIKRQRAIQGSIKASFFCGFRFAFGVIGVLFLIKKGSFSWV